MEMSTSRIPCTWNGARRSSQKVLWVTKQGYAFETNTDRQNFYSRSWRATIKCITECKSIKKQYQKNWQINKIYQDIKLIYLIFLLARIYSSPAALAKDLSSDACFRSIASFGHRHYLSTTSPHSIQCARNSWIWKFEFRKTLLPERNLWNFVLCKRFRPVVADPRTKSSWGEDDLFLKNSTLKRCGDRPRGGSKGVIPFFLEVFSNSLFPRV